MRDFGEAVGEFSGEVGGAVNRGSPAYIAWLQRALNQILALNLTVDGIMGSQTRSAIRSLQERQGLTVDGIVGPQTESALLAAGAPPPSGAAPPITGGARAGREEIRWVQMALNQILGLNLALDGLMGPQTSGAIRSFQMQQGLPASGGVDSPTSQRMALALAGKPAAQVCASLREKEILENFAQAKADVRPAHEKTLAEIALCVRERLNTADPIRSISMIGHASTEGDESFNRTLGQSRADRVKLHLSTALDRVRPGLSNQVVITTDTRGESESLNRGAERDRRVEIFLPTKPRPAPLPPPPPPPRPSLRSVVDRCIAVLATQPFPAEQRKRLTCLLAMALNPNAHDLYINGKDFFVRQLARGIFPRLPPKEFVTVVASGRVRKDLQSPLFAPPGESDSFVRASLEALDERILSGIQLVSRQMDRNSELNVRNPVLIQMNEFISIEQRNVESVYFCYGTGQQ